ncbi:ferric reductase [Streptomyces caeruleatus]|uniref:ferric reductase n=1 Tax=Streptomyces caeruleatus TaxID=661399 RepID=UPI000A6AB091|nr:ferric reductase [Streptomyces caeruleatus]
MTSETLWYANRATGAVCLVLFTGRRASSASPYACAPASPGCPASAPSPSTAPCPSRPPRSWRCTSGSPCSTATSTSPPSTVLVPFVSDYQPRWLGLGTVALDLMLAVLVTSLLRERLGHRAWRAVHWLAYASWPLALIHGVGIGTDTGTDWMTWLTVACVAAVVTASGLRLAHSARAARRTPAALLRPAEGARP